ncbi:GNAT family N-acetyltransferase [Bacillus sp. 165]|uniref:GNAT family N-acetyltransferase n=1 Tax=Bacillus sp. 165 TaxID=1529117 RepID=UPI001AD9E504|nr:GNAT family N-acetyltransferase [Bacillus sp. 165]MBO9131221.1 GNAT family N-acetyltransferase [Bacillus sp. 165]
MIHKKVYNAQTIKTEKGTVIIEGPVLTHKLESYKFHEDLTAFRPAFQQQQALIDISKLPEARIILARLDDLIVGYVTYLHPDPLERWSEGNMNNLIELGAIEVIPDFRGCSVGKTMLKVSMMDEFMENYIIITTEYYWHWDLKGTGLNVWDYRKVMEKMMNAGGLEWMATDDPEICSHPANCLMVRIGKQVDQSSIQQFDRLRFQNRFMY